MKIKKSGEAFVKIQKKIIIIIIIFFFFGGGGRVGGAGDGVGGSGWM